MTHVYFPIPEEAKIYYPIFITKTEIRESKKEDINKLVKEVLEIAEHCLVDALEMEYEKPNAIN